MKRTWMVFIFAALVFTVAGTALAQTSLQATASATTATAESSAAIASALVIIAQFLSSAKVTAFSTWGIQAMKDSELKFFSWIGPHTTWVTRAISLVAAGLTASGVDWVWNGMDRSLMIHIPTLVVAAHAIGHTSVNYMMQKGWYKSGWFNAEPPPAGK